MKHPARAIGGRAFTLIELSVSTAITGILLVSLASVVVVASKVLPSARGPTDASLAAGLALDQLLAELRFATSITESTATAVTFTVPDRDANGTPETIRYSWAGADQPLVREYNGVAADVVPSLRGFALRYSKHKYTDTSVAAGQVSSGEVLLSSYNGWTGLLPTSNNLTLSATSWGAEQFVIDRVSFPANVNKVTITRVSLRLRKPTTPAATAYTVGIYLPSAAGSNTPAASPVGTEATMSNAPLTTSYAWVDAPFTDVTFPDGSQTTLFIVAKGASTSSIVLNYYNALLAPLDNYMFRYNTGAGWQPASTLLNQNDAPFFVYGTYEYPATTTVVTDTYTLGFVSASMQATQDGSTRIDGGIKAINEPTVVGP
jgi:prepilin-type N-terminal cleavage/methylation domain-containing protein